MTKIFDGVLLRIKECDTSKAVAIAKDILFRAYALVIVFLMPVIFLAMLVSYAIENGALKDMALLISKSLKCILKGYTHE